MIDTAGLDITQFFYLPNFEIYSYLGSPYTEYTKSFAEIHSPGW